MKRIVLTLIASVAVLCASAQIKGKVQEIDMEQFAEKIGFILDRTHHFISKAIDLPWLISTPLGAAHVESSPLFLTNWQSNSRARWTSTAWMWIKTNRLLKPCKCAACHSWYFSLKKERPKL